jgi:hypothetical protein
MEASIGPSRIAGEPRGSRSRPLWTRLQSLRHFALFAVLLAVAGCRKSEEKGEAPPPVVPARPGVCDGGGGEPTYDQGVFARLIGDYCLDPHGEMRAYGMTLPGNLDDVCVELFNGECEVYKRYGLDRVTTARYVDGAARGGQASTASVAVTLSRFSRTSGAYGFFTKRILSDGDPLQASVKPLDAGAAGALGGGIAYVWRGQHVLELTYVSEDESPDQLRASSAEVLPAIARELGERLPGSKEPLAEVQLLPQEHLIPLGVHYEGERLLGVGGTGAGALGHYRDGDRRWRVLVAIREDEQGASDLLNTLSRGGQGWPTPFKQRRMLRVRFAPEEDQKPRVWYLARRGNVLVGLGDDVFPAPSLVPSLVETASAAPEGAPREPGDELPDPDLEEHAKLRILSELTLAAERYAARKPVAEGAQDQVAPTHP